jgi:hypothetical protein
VIDLQSMADLLTCCDCGLDITPTTITHWNDPVLSADLNELHRNRCCDCFDEKMGMPPEQRTRPRPVR